MDKAKKSFQDSSPMRVTIHVDIDLPTQKAFRDWQELAYARTITPKETRAYLIRDFEQTLNYRMMHWLEDLAQDGQEREEGEESEAVEGVTPDKDSEG